ncbi:MAG: hypothetical protein E6J54_29765 [Deltaproteobacteria bacterium]|nr:MAG: hypothetical protein E6J54_29765 [Deltaproteobacteria bacterium]
MEKSLVGKVALVAGASRGSAKSELTLTPAPTVDHPQHAFPRYALARRMPPPQVAHLTRYGNMD